MAWIYIPFHKDENKSFGVWYWMGRGIKYLLNCSFLCNIMVLFQAKLKKKKKKEKHYGLTFEDNYKSTLSV